MHAKLALLLPFLASTTLTLAAPISLPMPLRRRGFPNTPSAPAARGLLGDLVDTTESLPVVSPLLDTVSDIPIVGPLVDTTLDTVDSTLTLLDPLVDVALGVHIDLQVDTWLTCGLVGGLFGGRTYDLGCTCTGGDGGLLLGVEVDLEAVVNVAGLDAWVKAQVSDE